MFSARRMVAKDFKTDADYIKRLPDGSRCIFAVENEAGATIVGLAWWQAVQMAAEFNAEQVAA